MFETFSASVTRTVLGAIGTTLCAGVCLVAAAGPADAAPVAAPRTAIVSYTDLDVRTAPGRAALDRRLAAAAHAVCTSADTGPAARVEEGRCVRHAVAAARPVAG